MLRKHRAAGALSLVAAFAAAALSGGSCAVNEIGQGDGGSGSGRPPATCTDGIKDGDEADADCGGSCAVRCTEGKMCGAGSDCSSTFCITGVCVAQCNNSAKEGDETDIDCGGSCSKCADGRVCGAGADCSSNRCVNSVCASCTNSAKDGDETDTDCGGSCATKCSVARDCQVDQDCFSGACALNVCMTGPASVGCFNGVTDNQETGPDCGGGVCAACITDQGCKLDSDCAKILKCKGAPTMQTCQQP
jgi:hypothetical protein